MAADSKKIMIGLLAVFIVLSFAVLFTLVKTEPASDGLAGNDAFKGNENASVTVVEFSDFQCPACGSFEQVLKQIDADYVATGKVKLVYRDFPLQNIHPQAMAAAIAAECANEQGKFWEYHDILFQNQQFFSAASFKAWAGEIGLDAAQFNSCVDARKYASEVQEDLNDGVKAGVTGTPTIFIVSSKGQQKLVGLQSYENVKQAIDMVLE